MIKPVSIISAKILVLACHALVTLLVLLKATNLSVNSVLLDLWLIPIMDALKSWDAEVTMIVQRSKRVLLRSVEILVKTKLVLSLRFARSSITTPGVSSCLSSVSWTELASQILASPILVELVQPARTTKETPFAHVLKEKLEIL